MSCSTLNLTIACQPGFGGHDLPSLVGDRPQGKLIKIWFPSSCLLIIGEAVLPVHAFVCVCVCVCVCACECKISWLLSSQFYSLYWQGFKHPVSLPMPSISMLAISYFSLLYSLRGEEKARIWKLWILPELCDRCAIVRICVTSQWFPLRLATHLFCDTLAYTGLKELEIVELVLHNL